MSVAASFFVENFESALAVAESQRGLATWLELRLDRAPEMDFQTLVAAMPLPVIAACHRESEGGFFQGGEELRQKRLLEAAAGGARFVDLPLGAPRPEALPSGVGVIHSWHEQPGENADLRLQLHRIEGRLEPGDVAKVVSWAEDHLQAMKVARLYGTTRAPLLAFAQGPGGSATRAWAPVFGAPWIYASVAGAETGVGQWPASALIALYPPGGPGPQTNLYGVVGRPVAHSKSPLLWNHAFRLTGLDAFYLPLEVPTFDGFLHAHGFAPLQGFSVTAPFKAEALAAAQNADPVAKAVGAANTLHRTPKGWKAYATDGPAALDAMIAAGLPAGIPLLVLGAGGAARAVVYEGARRGHPVTVAARRLAQAEQLCHDLGPALAEVEGAAPLSAVSLEAVQAQHFGGVLQATPVGSRTQPGNLLSGRRLVPETVVLDMVYEPIRTALLAHAEEQGAVAVDGLEMLLRQMLAQFEIFTGLKLEPAPLRQVLQAEMERPS
ncbi:MAG: type I 3-dehydroquinate dehydratase [Planctomycetota bacterium]|nr:MAG: type I 3-dehydroquinate dehydratase [Planctomycetota bacterium]